MPKDFKPPVPPEGKPEEKPKLTTQARARVRNKLKAEARPAERQMDLDLSTVNMEVAERPAESTTLPPFSLPSKQAETPEPTPDLPVSNPAVRRSNSLGLKIMQSDDCHHLSNWKGGLCTIKGNCACPYLEGNQSTCEEYAKRGTIDNSITARRANYSRDRKKHATP